MGPDFRVHGYDNLYIADASVIPSSLTVNPQLTVMGLAHPRRPADEGGLVNGDYDVTPLRVLGALGVYAAIVGVYWVALPRIWKIKPRIAKVELPTAAAIGLVWAVSVFIANYLLYRAGAMSFLPWV